MPLTTLSSRDFNQDVGRAKRAADSGPVVITDRGKPAYVLMRHAEFQRLTGTRQSIVEMLRMPDGGDIEFDPPKANIKLKIPDLS